MANTSGWTAADAERVLPLVESVSHGPRGKRLPESLGYSGDLFVSGEIAVVADVVEERGTKNHK